MSLRGLPALCMGFALVAATMAMQSTPVAANRVSSEGALGPKGEVPLEGISDEDVAEFARGAGISSADAHFVLFDGGKAISDFVASNQDQP